MWAVKQPDKASFPQRICILIRLNINDEITDECAQLAHHTNNTNLDSFLTISIAYDSS